MAIVKLRSFTGEDTVQLRIKSSEYFFLRIPRIFRSYGKAKQAEKHQTNISTSLQNQINSQIKPKNTDISCLIAPMATTPKAQISTAASANTNNIIS